MQQRLVCASTFVAMTIALAGCLGPDDGESDTELAMEDSTGDQPGGGPVTPERIASGGDCSPAMGAGTEHGGDVTADEVWAAADGPHRITANLRVLATVTVEPCVHVVVDPGVTIEVGSSSAPGTLVAQGEATDDEVLPILFEATQPDAPWGRMWVWPTGVLELSVAGLVDGGAAQSDELGALVVQGVATGTNGGDVTPSTTLDRVLITRSRSHGLNLDGWAALTEASTQVWIRDGGSDSAPSAVRIEPGVGYSLPTGLEISGNLRDEIVVRTSKAFMRDDTWADHGVPYRQLGILYLNPGEYGALATLTIEPGVTVAFDESAGTGIIVGSSDTREGMLVADGTEDAPILLTSAQDGPAAGDWMGVVFSYVPQTGSIIRHARIEYAGAESGHNGYGCGPMDNDAAIIVHGRMPDDTPPDAVVTDTEFADIAGGTVIVSGWTGDGPNLSERNVFGAGTPACKVSRPKGDTGSCDGEPPLCWP